MNGNIPTKSCLRMTCAMVPWCGVDIRVSAIMGSYAVNSQYACDQKIRKSYPTGQTPGLQPGPGF